MIVCPHCYGPSGLLTTLMLLSLSSSSRHNSTSRAIDPIMSSSTASSPPKFIKILDTTTRTFNRCLKGRQNGTDYPNPKETPLGQSTYPEQCPGHRDEGYSRR
ncbi:hypothetical protein BJX68DRAFT_239395 [Aspergillus pseudodeflectus]|uniref:Secreted protein n=1 Tax=Aspergillus pseudodeflectus TaxID=176178 RepID=A0ABR4K6G9_9EURO